MEVQKAKFKHSGTQIQKNMILRFSVSLCLLLALQTLTQPFSAWAESADSGHFVRVRRDSNHQPLALETSISHYVARKNAPETLRLLSVDLIAAVHVGEKSYYEQLNHLFESYDAVLYELVAPKVADMAERLKNRDPGGNPISFLQMAIKDALKLDFQLDAIDYGKKNFVHADMSPDEFENSMSARNESFLKIFFRAAMASYAREARGEGKPPDLASMLLLFGSGRSLALKRLMAAEFEDMQTMMDALNGPEGSTLLSERNKVALKVLGEQVTKGKRKLAIFYGGAHLLDMSERLLSQQPLERESERWLVAWDLGLSR